MTLLKQLAYVAHRLCNRGLQAARACDCKRVPNADARQAFSVRRAKSYARRLREVLGIMPITGMQLKGRGGFAGFRLFAGCGLPRR